MKTENVNRILASTPRIYNKIASDFSDTRGVSWEGFSEFAEYAKDGDKILDLGCGNGRMSEIFEGKNVKYFGIDNSVELIEIARDRYKDKGWVEFEVGDALNLFPPPFQGGFRCDHKEHLKGGFENRDIATQSKTSSWPLLGKEGNFNLVLMIAMLHHIPTHEHRLKILKSVFETLKPGGRLVISNWNLWKINSRKPFRYYHYLFNYAEKIKFGAYDLSDAFVPWKANLRQSEWHARYVHSFGKREMKSLLKQAGFTVESLGYASKKEGSATIFTGDNLLAVAVKK